PAAWDRGALACLKRRLAVDRRRRPTRPPRRRRRARPGATVARQPAAPAPTAGPCCSLPEPLRGLGLRAWPLRQSGLLDRLRARPQPPARSDRCGRLCGRAGRRDAAAARRAGADRRCQPRRLGGRGSLTGNVRLGLRANARQFALLVALNALVGGMVGLERSVLPLVGKQDFGLSSTSAILAFVVAFGAAKAFTNLAAGGLAERFGRKRQPRWHTACR